MRREVGEPRFGVGQWRPRWRIAVEMGLSWEGGRPKTRWREGKRGGQKGRARGRKGRAKGGKGWKVKNGGKFDQGYRQKGGKFETSRRMRVWCDPQLGDEGKV